VVYSRCAHPSRKNQDEKCLGHPSQERVDMKISELATATFIGLPFAGLSILMIKSPSFIDGASIFLVPGVIIAVAISGNAHVFRTSVMALGNFGFYFAVTWTCLMLWKKYTARANTSN